jgi:hypothetical protein
MRRADTSSRGIVPIVLCLSMIGEPHKGGFGLLGDVEPFCNFSAKIIDSFAKKYCRVTPNSYSMSVRLFAHT